MTPLENCEYSYKGKNDRPIYVPTKMARGVGHELIKLLDKLYKPEPFVFHLGIDGGHVAALHRHRSNKYFAKVDLSRFFYSIGRNRVKAALKAGGVRKAEYYARWSCVKNPYAPPSYALPYGFVQSPILASLVLSHSGVGEFLRSIADKIAVSVYVDDIALSCNNKQDLDRAYNKLRETIIKSKFSINEEKSFARALTIDVFNCRLTRKETLVTDDRKTEFYAVPHSPLSEISFERYCDSVAEGNG
jgi:hypothetical protein